MNERRCDDLLRRSELLDTTDLDWDAVGNAPIDADAIATLVYMRDVEAFTNRYLTGLVAHPATLRDERVAQFLPIWQREEMEHARALDRYLQLVSQRCGVDVPDTQPAPPATDEKWQVLVTRPIGHVVTAAHMTWGAANELLTMTGYRLLARRSTDPVLRELLLRIAAQESRHYSFYFLQAQFRLGESGLARYLLAKVMKRAWTPVGVGEGFKSRGEFDRVLAYLSADERGRRAVTKMDGTFSRLPGLAGVRIFAQTAQTAA
ncbi:MAG: hypothetical protein QOK28_366 [Actinomycetota bacterium]|jgi:rubrerythrin